MRIAVIGSMLLSGCMLQVADPVVNKDNLAASLAAQPSNDIENFLVVTRVNASPAVLATGDSSILSVEFQENLGRPVSVSWFCNSGTLVSNAGPRVVWLAPDEAGVCECEATVKSKSGQVRGTLLITVQ